jgi:hypothetical protein
MERTEVLDMMGELRLYGMRNAYDEALATAVRGFLHGVTGARAISFRGHPVFTLMMAPIDN